MQKFFLIVDLLGFGQIIKNLKESYLASRIDEWVTLVKNGCVKYEVSDYQLISDTLFVGAGNQKSDLKKLILLGKYILEEGIKISLPVRGAITYDTFNWGLLIYGKAVIKGHELEAKQNWVGIVLDNYLPYVDDFYEELLIIRYAPPFKNSEYITHPVINWEIPNTEELLLLMSSKGLIKEKTIYSWNLAEKLRNTIEYSLYKSNLINKHGNTKEFNLSAPIQFMEEINKR